MASAHLRVAGLVEVVVDLEVQEVPHQQPMLLGHPSAEPLHSVVATSLDEAMK